ncbi:16S rRNA (adenine(1518)-N(6)/adenine(1519)-N(6))-dimethyltransferase RsmA [Helicobacter sp. 11S02596-1]|uniref:16S rRNA (adenine(1518)-N(6)/adenine(1519)-N(6))- dimethyltransferase RsmA n=1 Tax=Helicobacter sp. 11S02596-1 TaxID=1476194 RepID=UPI000BA50688|nr:16S rRNA (adenine(1518)-N(6)/adenine(1519)-N(6))-dimethyltransferase RsmA [Helicobacter sp. 11S02596-1]PAF44799.1 16S rRNA (adenine(1518)-N(6)/adenine(1519)-N(6))-dimethyltransferase [Helicobacter sp. 11S02596-1]
MHYRAKKQFGQNFLKNSVYVDRIVQSVSNVYQGERLVEIGPGLGDLTDRLLGFYQLKAYEVDRDLCSLLAQKYHHLMASQDFELICQDVLNLPDDNGWLDTQAYVLVSNLPYYIASIILLRALKDPCCKGFVVMTQKEVAQKFCAQSGERDFCALSVLTQTLGDVKMLFDVPKEAFSPVPKVTSSVFMMKKNGACLPAGFEAFLKICFTAPRKKLLNNLANRYDKEILQAIFKQLGIQEDSRAHQVRTTTYHQIFENLKAEKYGKQ